MIVDAEVRPFRLRMHSGLTTAKGSIRVRSGALLILRDDAGRRGFGEANPIPGFGPEDAAISEAVLADWSLRLRGRRVEERDALLDLAEELAPGAPAARFALDTALADLASQRAGTTLADWLAGGRAPRRAVPVNALVSGDDPSSAIAAGFGVFKLKVGARALADDIERVRRLRRAVGPGAAIRLDANGGWSLEEALIAVKALAPFDIEILEEPISVSDGDGVERLANLKESSPIPLAADECLGLPGLPSSPGLADRILSQRAVHALVLKPSVLGGLRAARRLAERARAAGLQVIVTSGIDGAIGLGAALHLAASLEGELPACGLATAELLAEDLGEPLLPEHGQLALPAGPGLGVVADRERPWLRDRADTSPEAMALELPERSFCYAELHQEASTRWNELRSQGVAPGDVVALSLESSELSLALHTVMLGGAIALPLNLRLTPAEIEFQLQDSGAAWWLRDEGLACLGDAPGGVGGPDAPLDPDRVLAILYTSGTTGRPKGAVLWASNFRASARASAQRLGSTAKDRTLACLPLYHVGGISVLVRALLSGSCVVVQEKFDAEAVARSLDRDGITDVSFVANTLSRVLEVRGDKPAPESLRNVLVGGGPVPPALLERARALGYPIAPTYGLTEATSQVATNSPLDSEATGLRALPGVEIEIDAPSGKPGEIRVRGATVMRGYRNRPDESARAIREGWLYTGDIGTLDQDGRLTVLDRRSDLIVSGGENVYPAEIESVLLGHPAVAEAGVGRCQDERYGSRPVAWWVPASPEEKVDGEDLRSFCRKRLASFKVPVRFHRVDALPRTSAGKLVRSRLCEPTDGR